MHTTNNSLLGNMFNHYILPVLLLQHLVISTTISLKSFVLDIQIPALNQNLKLSPPITGRKFNFIK